MGGNVELGGGGRRVGVIMGMGRGGWESGRGGQVKELDRDALKGEDCEREIVGKRRNGVVRRRGGGKRLGKSVVGKWS